MSVSTMMIAYAVVAAMFAFYAGWRDVKNAADIVLLSVLWPIAVIAMLGWAIKHGRGK
jgi:hypothetical protein